jgi:hypothetical protein
MTPGLQFRLLRWSVPWRFVLFVLFILLGWPARPAWANRPSMEKAATEARQHYGDGTRAFSNKRYAEAAMHFEAAAAAKPSPEALMSAGLAWDMAGRLALSADAYVRVLEDPSLELKARTTARERLAELEKTLGTLAVEGPRGVTVQLDGLTEARAPARLHAMPGVRSLLLRRPGLPDARRNVTLEAGKTTRLDVDEDEPAPRSEAPDPPEPPAESSRGPAEPPPSEPEPLPSPPSFGWLGIAATALGGASLGASALVGVFGNEAKNVFEKDLTREAFEHASRLETSANALLISGAVLLVTGLVVMVATRREAPQSVAFFGRGSIL